MRCCLGIYGIDHFIKFQNLQHQCLFCCIFCCKNLRSLCISAILRIFLEDGLDTHDRIKDIRSCISLKRCKAVHIKDIILGCLIGKISILNGSKTDFRRCLSCIRLLYCTVVHNLLIHLFVNLTDQILKTHHTAFSCLERLAVLSIHRTKSEEFQLGLRSYNSCLLCTAEYLDKMKFLTFIHNIDHFIRLI